MTSLQNSCLAIMAAHDGDRRTAFAQWLTALPSQPDLHSRFVNTLSMLEHIGSVKIARTQAGTAITEEILQHLAEETRHAQILKRIARRIGGDAVADYADGRILAGPAARGYFARIDAGVRAFTRERFPVAVRPAAAYLLVTLLVELRASWLYPVYQCVLEGAGAGFSVRSIIGEEERHLADIIEGMEAIGITERHGVGELVEHESGLFARLAGRMMEGEVQG